MDHGAWQAAVYGVAKSRTGLRNSTKTTKGVMKTQQLAGELSFLHVPGCEEMTLDGPWGRCGVKAGAVSGCVLWGLFSVSGMEAAHGATYLAVLALFGLMRAAPSGSQILPMSSLLLWERKAGWCGSKRGRGGQRGRGTEREHTTVHAQNPVWGSGTHTRGCPRARRTAE